MWHVQEERETIFVANLIGKESLESQAVMNLHTTSVYQSVEIPKKVRCKWNHMQTDKGKFVCQGQCTWPSGKGLPTLRKKYCSLRPGYGGMFLRNAGNLPDYPENFRRNLGLVHPVALVL
jgi:hypothetical protein